VAHGFVVVGMIAIAAAFVALGLAFVLHWLADRNERRARDARR
jgi:hypothetical protein